MQDIPFQNQSNHVGASCTTRQVSDPQSFGSQNSGPINNPTNEQSAGTCPLFGSSRQPRQQNPYYTPQMDRPLSGNQTMNNPYISAQNPIQSPSMQGKAAATQVQPETSSATGDFVKGALIGAAVTYLLTNEKVQKALFQTVAKTSNLFQVGMEEVKERYEDAKAETAAKNMDV